METKIKKVYYCGYCKKYYLRKDACVKHEKYCPKNPNNKHACFEFCKHLEYEKHTEPCDSGYGNYQYTTFKCEITKKYMYSYIGERKSVPEVDNCDCRMPLECEHYKCEWE